MGFRVSGSGCKCYLDLSCLGFVLLDIRVMPGYIGSEVQDLGY